MKKLIFFFCLSVGIAAQAQTNTYLSTNFTKGIPTDFTIKDYDENPITTADFKENIVTNGWTTYAVDSKDSIAAISTSRGDNNVAANNWMITPAVNIISQDAWLIWDAKSVHYDLRDSYKVMISTTDMAPESFKEVFSIEEEDYFWAHHFVSLKAYQGKNIYVAFVLNSKNKYILAIDNLFIGVPTPGGLEILDDTPRFTGSDVSTVTVEGKIRNLGGTVKLKQLDCVLSDDASLSQKYDDTELLPGEEASFKFKIPVKEDSSSVYTLKVTTDTHSAKELLKDSVICSRFPMTMVVEEFTGNWCATCPMGTLYMNRLKKRYKDQLISIVGHSSPDPMYNKAYHAGLNKWIASLPALMCNRSNKTVFNIQNYKYEYEQVLAPFIVKPVTAKAELTAKYTDKDFSAIETSAKLTFAVDYDNSSDRYKLGYALVEKTVTGYQQKNGISTPPSREFNFLPVNTPGYLMFYHDVARGTDNAFTGIEHSLPEVIEKGQTYTYDYTIEYENTAVSNKENLSVVIFIIDTKSGNILSACEVKNPERDPASIAKTDIDALNITAYQSNDKQNIIVQFPDRVNGEDFSVRLSGLDGKTIFSSREKLNGSLMIPVNGQKGCYIITLTIKNETVSKKVMLL